MYFNILSENVNFDSPNEIKVFFPIHILTWTPSTNLGFQWTSLKTPAVRCCLLINYFPHFLQEIHTSFLEEVQMIDLSPSTSEVRDLILTELMQTECSELWKQHHQIQTKNKKTMIQHKLFQNKVGWSRSLDLFWKAKLYEIFLTAHNFNFIMIADFLEYVMHASAPLLQDPEFLPHVFTCQSVSLLNLRQKSRSYLKR